MRDDGQPLLPRGMEPWRCRCSQIKEGLTWGKKRQWMNKAGLAEMDSFLGDEEIGSSRALLCIYVVDYMAELHGSMAQ